MSSGSVPHERDPRSDLARALSSCRTALIGVAIASGVLSLLYLTGSLFMLEIYDRVIPGRSIPTLIGLSLLALILFSFQGLLDILRSRILIRIAATLDGATRNRIFEIVMRLPLRARTEGDGLQPLRDLDQLRSFISSVGLAAIFDLPWIPIFLAICFAFHFWIGITALVGAVILISLTILTDYVTRRPNKATTSFTSRRNALAEATRRNAEVVHAMGMGTRLAMRIAATHGKIVATQQQLGDTSGAIGSVSKVLRAILQCAVLAVGGYLVIDQQATAGVMIASSILVARALAPVELAIAHWRGFTSATQGWRRLSALLLRLPEPGDVMRLPAPVASVSVESLTVAPPGLQQPVIYDVSFNLSAGQALAIVGPNGSGKTSLARALVGAWPALRGRIRLDGAATGQWSAEALGGHIGYLPQDIELFSGTVAENIARFEPDAVPEDIIAAAQAAGVHDLILQLSHGYETQIGEGGATLSAGQRQRIGLARALYKDPFLVVLDEPNSNLDSPGEEALARAIRAIRARRGVLVVIAHRPSAIVGIDLVLAMAGGRAIDFGPREEVIKRTLQRMSPAVPRPQIAAGAGSPPLRVVGDAARSGS